MVNNESHLHLIVTMNTLALFIIYFFKHVLFRRKMYLFGKGSNGRVEERMSSFRDEIEDID
jgi:hypothetical protein